MKTKANLLAAGMFLAALSSGFGQPVITSQPKWQTNGVGSTAMFSVVVTGAPPLFYQWRFNGGNRVGATNDTLILTNVQFGNQGNYSVVVTNVEGAVTSILARLYVFAPPSITTPPESQAASPGETVTFSVVAAGSSLTYQWLFNNQILPGQNSFLLTLAGVQSSNAGPYTVVVANAAGVVTSEVARLTVMIPGIPHQFAGIKLSPDKTASLVLTGSVTALFRPYFDLYPVDVSSNLVNWERFDTFLLTNALANTIAFQDTEATNFPQRFYRHGH